MTDYERGVIDAVGREESEALLRGVAIVCRALVAIVLCLTGSCTIQRCFAPREAPVPSPADCYEYGCSAPAAYCGRHASPERGE